MILKTKQRGVLYTALTLVLGIALLTTTLAAPRLRLVRPAGYAAATAQTITAAAAPDLLVSGGHYYKQWVGPDTPSTLGKMSERDKDKLGPNFDNMPTLATLTPKPNGSYDLDILSSVYDGKVAAGTDKPLPWDDNADPENGIDRILVPGSYGFYNFEIKATVACAYEFEIHLSDNYKFDVNGDGIDDLLVDRNGGFVNDATVLDWEPLPIRYRLWNVTTGTPALVTEDRNSDPNPFTNPEVDPDAAIDDWIGVDVDGLLGLWDAHGTLTAGATDEYRLDWKWDYQRDDDTDDPIASSVSNPNSVANDGDDAAIGRRVYTAAAPEDIPYYRLQLALAMWADTIPTPGGGGGDDSSKIKLIFDPNGSGATVTPTFREYNKGERIDKYGALPIPTRPGYNFVRWTYDKEGTLPVNPSDIIPEKGATIYAQWTTKIWVNFDPDGEDASVTPDGEWYDPDDLFGFTLPIPERPGYEFIGWFDRDGNPVTAESYINALRLGLLGDRTIFARWRVAGETVIRLNFDPNGAGASVNPTGRDYEEGDRIDKHGPLPIPTRPGYTFIGWTYDREGTLPVNPSDIVPSQGGWVYAQWIKNEDPNPVLPPWIWILPPAIIAPLIPLIGVASLLPALPVLLGGIGLIGLGGLRCDCCWRCLRPCDECICEGKCHNPCCRNEVDDTDDQTKPPVMPPKTGDSSTVMWSALTMLALSGGLALVLSRKRREEEDT